MKLYHYPFHTTTILTVTIITSTNALIPLSMKHHPQNHPRRIPYAIDHRDSLFILSEGLNSQSTKLQDDNSCAEDDGNDQSVPRVIETKIVMAEDEEFDLPSVIKTNVLKRAYPKILNHMETYGNPNIPLGSKEGNYCKTLRRMAFQNTLLPEEVDLLTELGFRWNDFEDVYDEADFDDCLDRLIRYEEENKTGYQIPKKYKPDPELGAWVTMIRRKGRDIIEPERRDKLDAINFAWVSTRKCGSAFQVTYRSLLEQLKALPSTDDAEAVETILKEEKIDKWFKAQVASFRAGTLSDARCAYMDQLPGFDWRERMDEM